MRKITIRLLTVKDKGVTGYSIHDDDVIQIELDQKTYDNFERDAKRFGMDICDALGHGLTTLIQSGNFQHCLGHSEVYALSRLCARVLFFLAKHLKKIHTHERRVLRAFLTFRARKL